MNLLNLPNNLNESKLLGTRVSEGEGEGEGEGEVQVKVPSVSDGEDRGYTPLIVKGTFRYVTCTLLYGDWQYGFIKALRVVQST